MGSDIEGGGEGGGQRHWGIQENAVVEAEQGVDRPAVEKIWRLPLRTPAPQGRGGQPWGGALEKGEVQSDVGKTLAPIPREREKAEGSTRPPEWKTLRGKMRVTEWLEESSRRGDPKTP